MGGANQAFRTGKEKRQNLGGVPSRLLLTELAEIRRVVTPDVNLGLENSSHKGCGDSGLFLCSCV